MTDGRTDGRRNGGDCNIPDAFLKKRGDNEHPDRGHQSVCLFSQIRLDLIKYLLQLELRRT